jgi:hypothetical protein
MERGSWNSELAELKGGSLTGLAATDEIMYRLSPLMSRTKATKDGVRHALFALLPAITQIMHA